MNNPLQNLYDVEDFLHYFQVPYNPKIIKVVRLQLLKQFRNYLEKEQMLESNPGDSEVWEKQRQLLLQAYRDFVNQSPSRPAPRAVFMQANNHKKSSCSTCSSTGCKL